MASDGRILVHERTPLLANAASTETDELVDHHGSRTVLGAKQVQQQELSPMSISFWLLMLAYSILLFLFSSNMSGITTMYFAIAETLQAYHNAATWMIASYMVGSLRTS
jgi:hypothetical protein